MIGLVAIVLASVVAVWLLLVGHADAQVRTQEGSSPGAFTIHGEVGGLYPGLEATLDARIENTEPFPIRVTSVAVAVRDANPGCGAAFLHVDPMTTSIDLPAGAVDQVPIAVRMDHAAPDACQGAAFPLEFTGTAIGPARDDLPFTGAHVTATLTLATMLIAAGLLARRLSRGRRGQ